MAEKIKQVRVNIRMAPKIKDFYEELSNEMGVSMSYCMVSALKHYMDEQMAMKFIGKDGALNELLRMVESKK
jgi:predicted DNA-binding protein